MSKSPGSPASPASSGAGSAASRTLLVGTTKGLFLGWWDNDGWKLRPPAFPMVRVAAVGVDARRDPVRFLVGGQHEHWGPLVARSDDGGASWVEDERAALRFPDEVDASVAQIWQLAPGRTDRPDEVWAGVEPAALFRSTDGGASFGLVESLWRHEHRPQWHPGAGGLCLHTVLPHPDRSDDVLVAISAAGVYRSSDAGASWQASNSGVEARFFPDWHPQFGQCVHKVVRMSGQPDHLMLQNHGGVFRSSDNGASWELCTDGLPADFGFAVVAHPSDSRTAFVWPLTADAMRLPPDGRARVYRTTDFGDSWQPVGTGLPEAGFYSVVLRDAFCTDGADPAGLFFGTRSGEVWASLDAGETWEQAAAHLPDVLCVRAVAGP